jgi:hypothetical protein
VPFFRPQITLIHIDFSSAAVLLRSVFRHLFSEFFITIP